jgi:hypothetical protein
MHPRFNLTPTAPHENETGITEFEDNQGSSHHGGSVGTRFFAQLTIFRQVKRLHG